MRRRFGDAIVDARSDADPTGIAKAVQRALKTLQDAWPARARWACRSGCSFCCHNVVSVSAPEAFRLARAVRALPEPERLEVMRTLAARRAEGGTMEELGRRRSACALLSAEGTCRAYAARPLPCIGMASLDARACEALLQRGERAEDVPVDADWMAVSGAHNAALRLALGEARYSPLRYELHDALARALAAPEAEARWLAGEDLFAGCRVDPTCVGPEADGRLAAMDALTRRGPA